MPRDVSLGLPERRKAVGGMLLSMALTSFLTGVTVNHPGVSSVRQLLATAPERTMYTQFGFTDLARSRRWMERPAQPGSV